jgi:ATP-binding cassette subfamily B protein
MGMSNVVKLKQMRGVLSLHKLRVLFKPYRRQMINIILVMAIETVVEAGIIYSFMGLLDQALSATQAVNLNMMIGLLLASTVGIKLIALMRTHAYAKVMARISMAIRMALFEKLTQLDRRDTLGKVMTYFSEDLNAIEQITQIAVPVIVASLLGIIVSLCMLGTISVPLTLLAIVGLTLCVLSPMHVRKQVETLTAQNKLAKEHLMHQVSERIHGNREIIANNLEANVKDRFGSRAEQLMKTSSKAYFLSEVMEVLPKMMIELMNVLIVVIGIQMVFKGIVTAGALLAFNSLYGILSNAVASLTWALPLLNTSMVSLERLQPYIEEAPADNKVQTVQQMSGNEEASLEEKTNVVIVDQSNVVIGSGIRFDNVSYGYDEKDVLQDVTIDIPSGKHIAIVGTSGSGKSTLLHLLMKFDRPGSGSITIDDKSLAIIETSAYREGIGFVAQENYLFDLSVLENMRLFAPQATIAQIEAVLEQVAMLDVVRQMPNGLNTMGATAFSGGQKQRLAIARVILKKPQMLLLDEATSALDPRTERQINQVFDEVFKGRTIVNVSHRLEQVKHYDLIYVMHQGSVAEWGTHETLISHQGLYAELYQKQSGFDLTNDFSEARVSVSRLAEMSFFKPLPLSVLAVIMEKFVTEDYHPGEDIIIEGEIGTRFYIIVRGIVQIVKRDDLRGEVIVNQLEDGDYFGEIALLSPVARTATVRAKTRCMILSLRRNAFDAILTESPALKEMVAENMQIRLDDLHAK